MSRFSWSSGTGCDWNTAVLWDVGAIPNSGTAVVAITQPGGSASVLNADGQIFDTGTLSITGSITGAGTVAVENGGALEFGGTSTTGLSFAGSNVTVTLDSPTQYHGSLIGFGQGDTLILKGVLGSAASIINSNTLSVTTGGSTVALALAGKYSGATFATQTAGGNTVITNLTGAPARHNLSATIVSVTDNAGLSGSLLTAIENEVTFAAGNWGQYLTGVAPLRVALTFVNTGAFASELSTGSPGAFIANGQTINGHAVFIPDSLYTLQTGDYAAGTSSDIAITLVASATNLSNFYINTNPSAGTTVPLGKIDLLSDLTQEFLHGLGIAGLINKFAPTAGSPPVVAGTQISLFDSFVTDVTLNGTATATFTGPVTEAVYGAAINAGTTVPLPLFLTTGSLSVDNFYHVNNTLSALLQSDLLTTAFAVGTSFPISNIDLAMLQDIGAPVTANVTCYARGTLIQTTRGDVAVEDLRPGDHAITISGVARPVVWIGRRHVDCRRHPRPERVLPIRIAADAFEAGQPRRDLFVSPNHAIYRDGVLIPVRLLLNGFTVAQTERSSVEYYHVELDRHDILLAEGLPAESYLDCGDRHAFSNGGGIVALVAEFAGDRWETAGYAPLKLRGPELEAIRNHLRSRTASMLNAADAAITTRVSAAI